MLKDVPAVWKFEKSDDYKHFIFSLYDYAEIVATAIIEMLNSMSDESKEEEMLQIARSYVALESRKDELSLPEILQFTELHLTIFERGWFIPLDEERQKYYEYMQIVLEKNATELRDTQ